MSSNFKGVLAFVALSTTISSTIPVWSEPPFSTSCWWTGRMLIEVVALEFMSFHSRSQETSSIDLLPEIASAATFSSNILLLLSRAATSFKFTGKKWRFQYCRDLHRPRPDSNLQTRRWRRGGHKIRYCKIDKATDLVYAQQGNTRTATTAKKAAATDPKQIAAGKMKRSDIHTSPQMDIQLLKTFLFPRISPSFGSYRKTES